MNATNAAASSDEALLALRRTLWQLAVVGVVSASVIAAIAPEAQAIALWCVLAPLAALATHFRHAIAQNLWPASGIDGARRQGAEARGRQQRVSRPIQRTLRKGPMALRRQRPVLHLGAR